MQTCTVRVDLRAERVLRLGDTLLLDIQAHLALIGRELDLAILDHRDHALLGQLVLGFSFQARRFVIGFHLCKIRFLIEQLVFQGHFPRRVVGARCGHRRCGAGQLFLDLGIGQLQQHRIGLDLRSGFDDDTLDVRGSLSGDPADLLRHQRAWTAHFAQHLAALYRIQPDTGPLDLRRSRLQAGHTQGCAEQEQAHAGAKQPLPAAFLYFQIIATNIHWAR